ncbi:MAG: condensation domain-containing protein [Thermoanaerobaculia bacterium]
MKRKLSALEHMIDGNICSQMRLEGDFAPQRLRAALARVQRKHPALRALIREEPDGLYYEDDSAPEIPLRVLTRERDDDVRRAREEELAAAFPYDQPQLRAVWLRSERESDLLLTTSHRICDGMSMLTLVREVLRAIHADDELAPYPRVTTRDIIGAYRPPSMWKRRLAARALNGLLRLLPASRRPPVNREHVLEWSAGRELTGALRRRCKSDGVSMHAALLVALDRVLPAVLGRKRTPAWLDSPMDARRGRLAALGSDMLFFGGGTVQLRTGQAVGKEFWTRAKEVTADLRRQIDRETRAIPSRYHFCELLRPLSSGQIHTLVRLGDGLRMNGSWNRFALSNLGKVTMDDGDAPFRVKDLRVYVHSFNVRVLGIIAYAFDGDMRFCYVGDEKCLSRAEAERLRRELMALLKTR